LLPRGPLTVSTSTLLRRDLDKHLAALEAARIPAYVPVTVDLTTGLAALDIHPPRVRRTTELVPTVRIAQHVRALIDTACDEWQIPQCRETACSVASELASNAFEHGKGTFALALAVEEHALRISLQDDSGSAPTLTADGFGLRVIDQLSTSWGVIRHHPGKSVWALVDVFADAR
jgi:hypothetical protein